MQYAITLKHDSLTFRASHAIALYTDEAGQPFFEPMHEHLFRVRSTIDGPLNRHEYVIDFVAALEHLKSICDSLDRKILLPKDSTDAPDDRPDNSVLLLPCTNTTAESIAGWIAGEFRALLLEHDLFDAPPGQYRIQLELEESAGCWAIARIYV